MEILNQMNHDYTPFLFLAVFTLFLITLIILGIVGRNEWLTFTATLLILIPIVAGNYAYKNMRIKYEVIIHDISKFDYEEYKIIEQRGKLFIVEKINK